MIDGVITNLLEHIFQNASVPNVGDLTGLRGSIAAGNFYISLFETNPLLEADEAQYTGYQRATLSRSAYGFTVAGNRAFNYDVIQFPERTDSGDDIIFYYFGVHTALTGTGNLFTYSELILPKTAKTGESISFNPGSIVIEFNRR
jgi:hypothetical protein